METTNDVEKQAADWVAKMDAELVSADRLALFERWLNTDPEHEAAYLRLRSTWRRMNRLASLRPATVEPVNLELLAPAGMQAPTPQKKWRYWAAAASFLVVLGTLAGFLIVDQRSVSYLTQVGERRSIQLEDRSTLVVNTNSIVTVRYQSNRRSLDLKKGEAFFKVAKDTKRPFEVSAEGALVRAVGTAFDVRLKADTVEVTVTEGTVSVISKSNPGFPQRLAAGQIGLFDEQSGAVRRIDVADAGKSLAWQSGLLVFRGETLKEAVEEFNRYNKQKILLTDPRLNPLRVGGVFRFDDEATFLSALEASFDIRTSMPDPSVAYIEMPPP